MPARLPDETIQKMVRMRLEGSGVRDIARKLKIDAGTVSRNLKKYMRQGGPKGGPPPAGKELNQVVDRSDVDGSLEVLTMDRPATAEELMAVCKLDPIKWIPDVFRANNWQGFYKLQDGRSHRKVQMYQSRLVCRRIVTEQLEHAILEFVEKYGPKPIPKPKLSRKRRKLTNDQMLVWGFWDAHIGMYAWNTEVREDYDTDIAAARICNSVDDMVAELKPYPISRIVLPCGNDFMHFDSTRMTTTWGEHFLDVDTRFARVYQAGLTCLIYMVERALEVCDDVRVIYIPGNHDVTSSFTLCVALAQRFRNDPRVTVDLTANPRKYVTFGGVLLGFDHGRDATPDRLKDALAEEAREHWSASTYREVQIGDKHRKWEKKYESVIPTGGITVRRNPCLCNTDAWHHRKAFIGEAVRSVEAWRYDRVFYRGSHVAWARDEDHPRAKLEK